MSRGPATTIIPCCMPEWAARSTFYGVFPDRFCRKGQGSARKPPSSPWNREPEMGKFFRGDLAGIGQRLDFLKSMGADALYSTPLFRASSEHRYDTSDYFHIDPRLGSDADFRWLLVRMHSRGMRFIADAVFNHTRTQFERFAGFLRGEEGWYIAHAAPDLFAGRYSMSHPSRVRPHYETWEGVGLLPKLDLSSRQVRDYLLGVLRMWTSAGVDCWRFDVGESLPLDFLREMRSVLRATRPEVLMLGEVWRDP